MSACGGCSGALRSCCLSPLQTQLARGACWYMVGGAYTPAWHIHTPYVFTVGVGITPASATVQPSPHATAKWHVHRVLGSPNQQQQQCWQSADGYAMLVAAMRQCPETYTPARAPCMPHMPHTCPVKASPKSHTCCFHASTWQVHWYLQVGTRRQAARPQPLRNHRHWAVSSVFSSGTHACHSLRSSVANQERLNSGNHAVLLLPAQYSTAGEE
jgi:hypothetical protein